MSINTDDITNNNPKSIIKKSNDPRAFITDLTCEFIADITREGKAQKLIEKVNIEKENVMGYHGREILELLQNVDDAYKNKCEEDPSFIGQEVETLISYKGNVLTISNTGTAFTEDGIISIWEGNNSPKNSKYMGNKGTGFRSILNWASKIIIQSGVWNVEFSKEIAKEELTKIANKNTIAKQIEDYRLRDKGELYIPMLSVPKWTDISKNNPAFDTVISLTIDEKTVVTDEWGIKKQLEEFDNKSLLFLPNLTKITIEMDDGITIY